MQLLLQLIQFLTAFLEKCKLKFNAGIIGYFTQGSIIFAGSGGALSQAMQTCFMT